MKIFAAASTKDVWHKGRAGNKYQLDSILSQLNIEKNLQQAGITINNVSSTNQGSQAQELVNLVHSKKYLEVFQQENSNVSYLSNGLMLQPSLYPLALEHALIAKALVDSTISEGFAMTTIGGGHHCEKDKPLGFGLVNTMAISATYAVSKKQRVALLDLDTHYSNGCMDLLLNKGNILMTSLWNQVIPAWKYYEEQTNLIHKKITDADDYFTKLKAILQQIEKFKPTLIIYQLGFDVLAIDRMGGIPGMNQAKLLQREVAVKEFLTKTKIPYLIYRGGGYINHLGDVKEVESRKKKLIETQLEAMKIHWSQPK